jgi:hypothetical protein
MNKKIGFFFLLILFAPAWLFGQDETLTKVKTFNVGVVPQYAFSHGMRIDLDFRLHKPGQWMVVSPQFYLIAQNPDNSNYKELVGVGIELQHRLFFKDRPIPKGAYLGYGPVFQYFSVKDQGLAAYSFDENQVEYIGLSEGSIQTNIYKFGGNLILGIQTVVNDYFYVDAFLGTGIRISLDNRTSGLHGYYNDWWGDIGYSGTLIVAGIRFGVSL